MAANDNNNGNNQMSLFNGGWWDSMNAQMSRMRANMDAMASQMEKQMQEQMAKMNEEMKAIQNQMANAASGSNANEAKDEKSDENNQSDSYFHSCETHSFYDSNGVRVSHIKSHEKSKNGKESIKEEKRVGDKSIMYEKTRENADSEWKTEDKYGNISKDDKQAMIDFDAAFSSAFSPKNDQKAIKQ